MKINKKFINPKLNNTHAGHTASCLCCANFYYRMGYGDLSEITPGAPTELWCYANVFEVQDYDEFAQVLHGTGQHCTKFKAKKE